jgi:hypothetical protein
MIITIELERDIEELGRARVVSIQDPLRNQHH